MNFLFFISFLATSLFFSPTNGYCVELDIFEDSMIFNQEPDSNYQNTSSAQHLLAIRNPKNGGYTKISFLKFDLTDIEDHILSATLNLNFMKTESQKSSWLLHVNEVKNNAWKEDVITWNTMPELGDILAEVEARKPDMENRFLVELDGRSYVKYDTVPIELNLDFNNLGNTLSVAYWLPDIVRDGKTNYGGIGFYTKEHASPLARGPFLALQTVPYPPTPDDTLHGVHLSGEQGYMDARCTSCHIPSWDANLDILSMELDTDSCNSCHSPDGLIDGVNDPILGALNNTNSIESSIYDANGLLLPGKEGWCLTCHDDGHSTVNGVSAPNIAGKTITGTWKNPVGVVDNGFLSADTLIDGDTSTGSDAGETDDLIFDLGSVQNITHIRFFNDGPTKSLVQVYGSTDQKNWKRILYGRTVKAAKPLWNVKGRGWVETRIDDFSPIRYIKLVRISTRILRDRSLREFEYKADTSYGYLVSGHKFSCDYCHNTSTLHTDGKARTYTADQNNYSQGYRLVDVTIGLDTYPALEVPRVNCNDSQSTRTDNDFALCFTCHDKYNLLGDAYGNENFLKKPLKTFFRNEAKSDEYGNVKNGHILHLRGRGRCGNDTTWDSDWDGTVDSPISCTACHNVHGSPTPAMTRHGELVSTPGTTDKVPMLNFVYLDANGIPDPNIMDSRNSIGGITQFYRGGPGKVYKNHTCKMCHNDQSSYQRTP